MSGTEHPALSRRDFYVRLRELALPIAFQQFMLAAVSAGDAAMLGFVSQDALAAVSLATQVQFVENLFLGALVSGATLIMAQYQGKGDRRIVQRVFHLILRYAVGIGLLFFGASLLAPRVLMGIFAEEEALISIGSDYLRLAAPSFLLTGISQCHLCMMRTTGRAKRSAAISSFAMGLDTVLNAIFIFGLLGVPAMGARGAALTTSIARAVELLLVLWDARTVKDVPVQRTLLFRLDPELEREFWYYSFPVLLNHLVWGLGTASYSAVIGHLGGDITAANSIAAVIKNVILCFTRGVANGGGILLASVLGAGELESARVCGRRLSRLSVLCGLCSGALVLLVGPPVSRFMALNDTARYNLRVMLYICAFYLLAQSVNIVVVNGIFHAGGDTRFDAYSVAVTMWLIIIPLASAAAFWWRHPPLTVYFILSMDEAVKIPWVYIHYKKYKWVKNITEQS